MMVMLVMLMLNFVSVPRDTVLISVARLVLVGPLAVPLVAQQHGLVYVRPGQSFGISRVIKRGRGFVRHRYLLQDSFLRRSRRLRRRRIHACADGGFR
jgi:hypothetical protein